MTHAQRLAEFVHRARFEDLSPQARQALKIRILDALGCARGAFGAGPVQSVRRAVEELGGREVCSLIGGGQTSPDRAALYNGALVRYLDFNDSYLAPGETCHPSDNLAPVLAAAEYADASGRELLTALAVAYQVHCRLSDEAPVRKRGFDHATQAAYAAAAGVARALRLDPPRIANAVSLAGAALNALRVTRTGALSHWKGLAVPFAASAATVAAFLAMHGVTGPPEVFEGIRGFMDTIAGKFDVAWEREDLGRVTRTVLKKYNAEIHAQSAIEGLLEMKLDPREIESIHVDIFDVAYDIIGGGEEGDRRTVRTKEEADHSLPYLLAVAALDGTVMPDQYRPERILREDVQSLLRRVTVRPDPEFSALFPNRHPCRLTIRLKSGRVVHNEKTDYEGFHTRPMDWDGVLRKFEALGGRPEVARVVETIEDRRVREMTTLLRERP